MHTVQVDRQRSELSEVENENTARAFMQTSTIHGLAEIARSKKKSEKTIFVVAFIVCITFSMYGCYQIVKQFIERPVATSYFIHEADDLQLPDVTICPFNRLDRDFITRENISEDLAKYIQWAYFLVGPIYTFVDFAVAKNQSYFPERERELNAVLDRLSMTFETFLREASLQCSDLVAHCMQQYTLQPCCNNVSEIMTTFGKCFRINGSNQTSSGFGMGMTIMLNISLDKFTVAENLVLNDGVMLKLTEPGKGYDFDAIFMPPGVHALVQLRATKLQFINDHPRYRCHVDDEDGDYAPLLCYHRCMIQPVNEICNCRYAGLASDPNPHNLTICRPYQILQCAYDAIKNKTLTDETYAALCKDKCKPRCTYWQYNPTVSYATYPSKLATKYYFSENGIYANYTGPDVHGRLLVVELFYDKLEYTLIQHFRSVTADQFLADIGGQIGLWVGASILSLIHLIVYVVKLIKNEATGPPARMEDDPNSNGPVEDPQPTPVKKQECRKKKYRRRKRKKPSDEDIPISSATSPERFSKLANGDLKERFGDTWNQNKPEHESFLYHSEGVVLRGPLLKQSGPSFQI